MTNVYALDAAAWDKIWPELVKGIPAAFVALVVAGIAGYIAWRQYQVARAKLNLDLFEKRFAVYELVRGFLVLVLDRNVKEVPTLQFKYQIAAHFLFGSDIGDWIESLFKKATELERGRWRLIKAGTPQGMHETRDRVQRLEAEFTEDLKTLRTRFGKYMDFAEWH